MKLQAGRMVRLRIAHQDCDRRRACSYAPSRQVANSLVLLLFFNGCRLFQQGGRDIFHELDYQEQHDRRFITEEEERNVVANDDKPDLGSLTTPTFVWKTEDIDTARTLISLRVGKKKVGVPY
jgi:hypothetical protein